MPTYQPANADVKELANSIIGRFESHQPLLDAEVQFDYVFAFPDYDEDGAAKNEAIKKNGVKALGLCRILPLKDRAMGRGDVEITLDGEWWQDANEQERAALLDHELHHAEVKKQNGCVVIDDLRRPKIKLRKHDVEIGWFNIIAERHGAFSQECQQAKSMMDYHGQLYWPDIAAENPVKVKTNLTAKGAIKNFVSGTQGLISKGGLSSVEITTGGKGVRIDKEGVKSI